MKLLGLWHSIDAAQHNRRLFAKVNEIRFFFISLRCAPSSSVTLIKLYLLSADWVHTLTKWFSFSISVFGQLVLHSKEFAAWLFGFFELNANRRTDDLKSFVRNWNDFWSSFYILCSFFGVYNFFSNELFSIFLLPESRFFSFQFHYHAFSHTRASIQTETVDKRWGFTGAHVDWLPLPIRSLLKNILFCLIFI